MRTAFGALDRFASPAGEARGLPGGGLAHSLVEELFSGSAEQRARAATRIEAVLGLEAVEPLCEALTVETGAEVLAAICASLGRLGAEEAYDFLRPHLTAEEPSVRAAAIEACLRLVRTEPDRSWLVELGLGDASAPVRRRTFLAAAALPGFELLPLALRCRTDGDPHVRRLAYVALASESDPAVARRALEALSDPDEGVRRAVGPLLSRRFGVDGAASASSSSARSQPGSAPETLAKAPDGAGPVVAAAARTTQEPGIPFEEIELVLMTSLRGATLADLVERLDRGEAEVARVVERYLAEGRLVLRGSRLYLP